MIRNFLDRSLKATYAFCLCMALTFGATYFAYRSSRLENAGRFDRTVTTISNTLRSRMTVYLNALVYTNNLFGIKPNLTAKDFNDFVQGMHLQENFPGIQTMGYIERLSRSQAKKKLAAMKLTLDDTDSSPTSNELDLILYFVKLQNSTSTVQGKDLGTSPARKNAMNEARDLGVPVASNKVLPMGNITPTTYAFLVFMPRYRIGADISTVENRRKALIGFVYSGFRASNLFGRVSDDVRMQNANLAVRIYDGVGTDPSQLMYTEGNFENIDLNLSRVIELKAANHTWTVEVAAPKNFGLAYLKWSPFFVLALGTMLSLAVMISLIKSDRLAKSLKFAREEAEKANHAKSLFLANISHEIRTPLGIIIGFAESALADQTLTQSENYLKTILRSGKELARIIGDVLDLSKIEAKTLLIENNTFSLKKLNEEIRQTWEKPAKEKGLKFYFDTSDAIPDLIESDEVRVKQILVNLLSNAFKFTSEGTISVKTSRVASSTLNQEFIVYTIDDTGIGIREENKSKLFKAFSQEDSSITRKFGGSGLGLAISKELAQALGGDLTVEQNPNVRGSRFIFKIPLVLARVPLVEKENVVSEEAILKGKKILLVEDSVDNQVLLEFIFKKYGVDIAIANNGKEGVEKVLNNYFDLILMDIQMPVMDGYAAFSDLKSRNIKIPVIALTAHALKDEREKALKLGFAAYLTKPIDRVQLVKVSAMLIDNQN